MQLGEEAKPLVRRSLKASYSAAGPFFLGIILGAMFMGLAQSMDGSSGASQVLATAALDITHLTPNPKPAAISREDVLNGQVILSGHPSTKASTQFTGHLTAGTWECEAGSWRHAQAGDEFVQLLEGKMTLIRLDGHAQNYNAPTSFVIPDGWAGVWNVTSKVKKFWVA